jgi:YqaJ-like viral recombinase domain
MAQADSVPTAIPVPITGATANPSTKRRSADRRHFIGGSDARIIMGGDQDALLRLWQEKRGEIAPEDLCGNLVVQLGLVTEELNRRWYEANTGQVITDVQSRILHPALRWMAATLDGRVQGSDYMAQLQHNMWVVAARTAVLSVITGGGKPPHSSVRSCRKMMSGILS